MFTRKMMLSTGFAALFGIGASTSAMAAVIDAYFGMNYLGPAEAIEVQLMDITYLGGSGFITQPIPAFPGRLGMPDDALSSGSGTYTSGGNGESTRTLGIAVPIDWNGPTITITDITVNVVGAGSGIWTAHSALGYEVGLIPLGFGTELSSPNPAPYGDIYGGFSGAENPIGSFFVTSTPPGLEALINQSFGDFRFAAAAASPVPVPAALWLFGSGLLGLVGIVRRKRDPQGGELFPALRE